MAEAALRPLFRSLVGLFWLVAVVRIFHPLGLPLWFTAIALGAILAIAVLRLTWQTGLLCAILAVATCGLGLVYGVWPAILAGLDRATIFPGFLATIVLLRATADQMPQIADARRLFATLDRDRRGGGIITGAFLLGSVLQVGVFAILAPIVGRDADEAERRRVFLVAVRGMSLVPFWSPFIVAIGVASTHLPAVPLWQVMALGLSLALLAILLSVVMFDRGAGPAAVWRALATLAPVVPPIAVAALIVVVVSTVGGLTTLQALVIGLPLPCIAAVAAVRDGNVRALVRASCAGLDRLGPEIAILTFALTLGVVFEAALPVTGLLDALRALGLSPIAVVFTVVMAMNLAGLAGVHPIVSGTIMLVLFGGIPTGVADLVLMQSMLVGWGLCTAISIGSLSIATGAAMFDLPPERLITGANLIFVFTASTVVAGLLAALNFVLVQ